MSTESEERLTPSERELERALRALRPAGGGVDPLVVAFAAGAALTRRSLWMWRSAAAVLCAALGVSILVRAVSPGHDDSTPDGTLVVQDTPVLPVPSTTLTYAAQSRGTGAYLRLRDQMLRSGFDAFTETTHAPPAAATDQPIPRAVDGGNWRPS